MVACDIQLKKRKIQDIYHEEDVDTTEIASECIDEQKDETILLLELPTLDESFCV